MGEVMKKLVMLCGVTVCLVVFMGAGEPGCEPMDRPVDEPGDTDDPGDPSDPADPDGPGDSDPDSCEEMFERCVEEGDVGCEVILEGCLPVEPDPCSAMYEECIIDGFPPEMCEEELWMCTEPWPADPCDNAFFECLEMGIDPFDCELEYENCFEPMPCMDMFDRCVMSEPDPSVCDVILIYCEPWPVDPCEGAFEECDMLAENCWMLEDMYWMCEGDPECEELGFEVERCWDEVFECDEVAWEICDETFPVDPCDEAFEECDMLVENCFMLEDMYWMCDNDFECEALGVEVEQCWEGVFDCEDSAWENCGETFPEDPCDEAFEECDMLAENCWMLEDMYWMCEGDPECEDLGFEVERCWDEVFECDEVAWEICDETFPEDPCDEAFEECDMLAENCWMLEDMYWMCEGDPECEELGLEVDRCWDEVFECDDVAWEACDDFWPEDPCEPFFSECDVLIDGCWELEDDEMVYCYETPDVPECEEYFERIDPCWIEAEACYDEAYELCEEPDPGFGF